MNLLGSELRPGMLVKVYRVVSRVINPNHDLHDILLLKISERVYMRIASSRRYKVIFR